MKNKYLIRAKLNKIKYQKSILEASPAIIKDKWIHENQQKLARLKASQESKLNQLRQSFDVSYYQSIREEMTKSLENKIYWKNREYQQTFKRHLKKTEKSQDSVRLTEELQTKLKQKLSELQNWRKNQEEVIIQKTTKVEFLDLPTKTQAKSEYDRLKVEFEQEYKTFESDLRKQTESRFADYLSNNKAKIAKIDEQLSEVQSELQSALTAEKESDLAILTTLNNKSSLTEAETLKKNNLTAFAELQADHNILLKLQDLTMKFGGLKAVDRLSFDVKQGEIFGLIGPNGAGKTTVFNCITQFYKASEGQIFYRDNNHEIIDLQNIKVHNVIKEGIVRTFQNVELIWELSVLDNLLVGAHSRYRSNFFVQLLHLPSLKREEEIYRYKATEILKMLNLLPYKDFPAYGLPYGILKRIELARTLMTDPKLIILDEPAAGLNDLETLELAKTIRLIRDKYQCTIFLVEHDMGLVMDICDRICAISFGKKLAIGTPKEIQQSKIVQESYLGGE